ncbi:MAG: hypothetical protein MPW15_25155 [Candidatus Manganitrophus sp.]|nr:hypothetical protein [Candidatus Manganitrophus sp.]
MIGRRLGKSVLFCNGEPDFLFVSKNRDSLSRYFLIDLPSEKQADLLVDKGLFYKMGAEYGFPIPRTWQPNDPGELEKMISEILYPLHPQTDAAGLLEERRIREAIRRRD